MGQQSKCRAVISLLQERVDDQINRLGRPQIVQVLAPKGEVGRRLAAVVPGGQGAGHVRRGCRRFGPQHVAHVADRRGGELVPPRRQLLLPAAQRPHQFGIAGRCCLAHEPGVQVEGLLDDVHQLVQAWVAHAVFAGRR